MSDHLELHGCPQDLLGHYPKAIGRLRVLAKGAGNARRHLEVDRGRRVSTSANFTSLPEATTWNLGRGQQP